MTDPAALAQALRDAVEAATPRLDALPDPDARPAPGKWSGKETLGHLVDSAANNHARFVRAALTDHLVFEGYDQDAWAALQRYAEADWAALVALWRGYNLHLARVIAGLPADALDRPRARHTLDRIAWQTVPASEPVTLAYFIADYIDHLRHHLAQILP